MKAKFSSSLLIPVSLASGQLFYSPVAAAETCELYPITVASELILNSQTGNEFSKVKLGNGTGNYSWLSWNGNNGAPSLADSLVRPGDSDSYINPKDIQDSHLDIGDWVEGRPGVKNSANIRQNLDLLLNTPIQIPLWSAVEGQGSQFDYLVDGFATIELTDYRLNGKGWVSFIYLSTSDCQANNAPVALDSTVSGFENTSTGIELSASDADNDVLAYTIITPPLHGTLVGDGPVYTYTPDADFFGNDSFEFLANDGSSDSNIARVEIAVQPEENSPPVAFDISLESTESTELTFTVDAIDPDDDPLNFIVIDDTANGLLIGTGEDGGGPTYRYIPNAGFLGIDSFTFVASDGTDDSNLATASIAIVPFGNHPPVAFDANLQTTESTVFDVFVTASDEDLDPLTYQVVEQPVNGTLIGEGPNYIYTPTPGFVGTDSFSFLANDGADDSNIANVTIEVLPAANNPPVALDAQLETSESTVLNITLFASDADNDPLSYEIVDEVESGVLNGSGDNYSYIPNPGFIGVDSFTFVASDGSNNSNIASVQISVLPLANNPPVIEPTEILTFESLPREFIVNAIDPDDDPLTFIIVQSPENGSIEGAGPGFIYQPDGGFIGIDFMLIKANDGMLDSETVEIRFIVEE